MLRPNLIAVFFLTLLALASPAFAGKKGCPTPDGFIFRNTGNGMGGTGINNGNGMGGTGSKLSERNGIGGTGIHNGNGMGGTGSKLTERNGIGGTGINGGGDIGVYGRITGFGSICVNGMEIEYKKATPVTDMGYQASTERLKVGQVVAVRAYKDRGEFRARRIAIEQIVSGKVSRLDLRHGTLRVTGDRVIANGASLKGLKDGDYVAVSGLRRADGAIMAGHIQRLAAARNAHPKDAASLFGAGVKYFSVQGYVRSASDSRIRLTDGTTIRMGSADNRPRENDRVIVMGIVDNGRFVAERIVPEQVPFAPVLNLPVLKGDIGGPGGGLGLGGEGGLLTPILGPDGLHLPQLGGGEISTPTIDVPAIDVPPVEIPGVPVIDIPPVDIPALPPIDIPVPPLPLIPDLPILPGK